MKLLCPLFGALAVSATTQLGRDLPLEEESNLRRLRSLCPCADQALESMALEMYSYQDKQRTNPGQVSVDQLVKTIKDIAYECTRRPECRCPEGYFKTRDGTECLKFSEVPADCTEAERACSDDFNSRLAIARDHARLTKIADIMQEHGGPDDYYWIGLSYNRTMQGVPVWTWVDGTTATNAIQSDLNMDLKKAGLGDTRMLDIEQGVPYPVERVAISSKHHGKVWKHESCRASGPSGPPKHKYICEFMMFKVKINAETKSGQHVGKVGEF
jgi:hypothetical protein